jgi:hypothetical protein
VNVAETLLVYVGAPLAIVVVLALLVYLPGGRGRPRYKSGQPWEHEAVWYEPHPDHAPAAGGHGELTAGHGSERGATAHPVSAGPLGGARGTW